MAGENNSKILCDIIIPVWDQPETTKDCLDHIIKNTKVPYRLIIIDNASGSSTQEMLEIFQTEKIKNMVLVRNSENLGFIKAVNQGLKISEAPYVCVLNNDTMPGPEWLSELINFFQENKRFGLLNPLCNGHEAHNMSISQYSGFVRKNNAGKYMEMNQCQGFCMLIKRDVIKKIGYMDERFGIGGFDDTDYSMRSYKEGYLSACVYTSYVYHREHKSFDAMGDRKKLQAKAEEEYFKKWPRHLRGALAFNLTSRTEERDLQDFLNCALYLAREWCWVNLFVFNKYSGKILVNDVMKRMGFPLHQNIKFNYAGQTFKLFNMLLRVLERSFGSKKRKKYDFVLTDEPFTASFLNLFYFIHKCRAFVIDYNKDNKAFLRDLMSISRKGNNG